MINRIDFLPPLNSPNIEGLKIRNILNSFGEEALVFSQNEGQAYISLLDGDLCIQNISADLEEIKSFLDFVRPKSVFSDSKTLAELGLSGVQRANVLIRESVAGEELENTPLKSDQVYNLLKKGGFLLPEYEFFAVDFCRRKNKGTLRCFGTSEGVAVTLNADNYCLLQGIVSLKKGLGQRLLLGAALQNRDKPMLLACEDNLKEYYLKQGFVYLYEVGYWMEKGL